MAGLSNKERVGRVLDLTAAGLGPWMVDLLSRKYGDTWDVQVRAAAGAQSRESPVNVEDPAYLFWVFDKQWPSLFRHHLSYEERRCVSSLWDMRKEWAHGSKFTDEQAERALSDGEHLLRQIGAVAQADSVDELRRELRRIRYEKDQKLYQAAVEKRLSVRLDMSGLPAWRDVAEPHDDVRQGTFQLAQFAADLRQVALGIARPEYGDPVQFFDRTYITRGLKYLISQTLQRLNGVGGEPVIDLMTTFGGGKTHSEIAVYHLAGGTPADSLLGVREICDEINGDVPTGVNRAVIVGNDFSVLGTEKPDGTTVRTLWGELAYQLGKKHGYGRVARYDENGVPPPTTEIAELLAAYAPCVILIDEWVAYLRQLYSHGTDNPYPAGTFDAHQTFAQSLTEAVKSVDTALLVVSLPASDSVRDMGEGIIGNTYEIGGTPGLEALRSLRSVIHRVETPWQPATVEESYEIVRRRIFKPLTAEGIGGRNLVVAKFVDFYLRNANMLPSEVQQPQYRDVMAAAYPIHPEMFNRLYQDWSTLERFQRTRGVLRLMATVVHALWVRGDQSALIMPASTPLEDTKVFEEITSHLDDPWKPVIDADIAGAGSTADMIDRDIPLLGKSMAGKRVARCVFLGTAPSVNKNARAGESVPIGGIEQKRVVLGATYPGDNPAHAADALRQLGDRGKYMNRDQDRYWLSLQQTVSRIMQELADGYDVSVVQAELTRTIREETDRGVFARVHRVPAGTIDVEDEPTAALVIFGLDRPHTKKATSVAAEAACEFIARRGGQPRIHKNTLVFLAPDLDRVDTLDSVLRRKIAWESIRKRVKELNLDQHNITVVENRLAQANQAVADTIRETYKWIIVPYQEVGDSKVELETIIMNGNGTLAERVSKKAESTEFVLRTYAPALLRQQIDRLKLWSKQPHIQVGTLCGYFTQYLYMPRVRSHDVIHIAIRNLTEILLPVQDGFAYADGQGSDGRYFGLVLHDVPIVVSNSGLLVDPEAAQKQIDDETLSANQGAKIGGTTDDGTEVGTGSAGTGSDAEGATTDGGTAGGEDRQAPATRFHAIKALDPTRPVRDISQISDEILTLFIASGAPVRITVDIESTAVAKLTPDQLTALKENLNTLGFKEWNVE
jgi:predicted AAA+ superfamily ATPase